jgi:hypothetical protein
MTTEDTPGPRPSRAAPPRYAPLEHRQVADLAEHMATVLGPSMLSGDPAPLALAAWMAHKALVAIAQLLDPAPPADAEERKTWLAAIADCADHVRHAAYRQWAAEATDTELAGFTEDRAGDCADFGEATLVGPTALRLLLPDGQTTIHVALSTAGIGDPEPDGWTTWASDSLLPLAPVDGDRHLEIQHLLAGLGSVISRALHPDLLEER